MWTFFSLHLCNCKDNRQISVPFDTIIFSLYVTNTPFYFELKCALKHTIVSLLRVGQTQRLKHSLTEICKNFNGFQNQTTVESQAVIQMDIKSHPNESPNFLLAFPPCLCLKLHCNWVKNLIYSIQILQKFYWVVFWSFFPVICFTEGKYGKEAHQEVNVYWSLGCDSRKSSWK